LVEREAAMPYRGTDNFWEPADERIHRLRVVAAIVLVSAGWATGFFAGRMSAWIFPVAPDETPSQLISSSRAAATVPPGPAPPAAAEQNRSIDEQARAAAVQSPQLPAPPDVAKPERATADAAPANSATADADTAAQRAAKEASSPPGEPAPEAKAAERSVTVINPDWARPKPSSPHREREAPERRAQTREADRDGSEAERHGSDPALEDALSACARRYASFRRSDGTYQPYGRSSRELCPLLR
jgi:hypothetical protein